MKRSDIAVETFASGLNCAQSVLVSFAGELGLERENALRIGCAFGAGMGRMALTCGAVTGAFMVIGLKMGNISGGDKQSKERAYALVNEFAGAFAGRNGSIVCRELLGCDVSTPHGLSLAKEKDLFRTICPKYVESAVAILEKLLKEQNNGS